ncbi:MULTISPECIES: ATP-binding protein [Kamptonema]|uniref:ATP-binding protein n=1 Tax=Kamptonema TaxID=1501433 RepID=UPI0001DACB91|nr:MULTISPECIES: ATP-binding protein [Kamptonema]CBN58672.1 hypothetical protein OSCI_3860024 [Kamptonema sp. PCC 6506]
MDSQEQDQEQQEKQRFLEDVAKHCQFSGRMRSVFLLRFDEKNEEEGHKKIEIRLKIEYQNVSEDLQVICKVLSGLKGKRGRPPTGESPWKTTYILLWTQHYPLWKSDYSAWQKQILKLVTENPIKSDTQLVESQSDLTEIYNPIKPQILPPEIPISEIHFSNPFIPRNGMIDNPQLFFPREREIRNIFETLNSGSSVAVIGQSAMGKSSLLMEICRQAPNKLTTPRQPIYLELNGCMDENQVYSRFANKIGIEISNGDLYSALQNHKLLLALDNVECQGFTRSVRDCLRSLAEGSQSPLKLVIAATKFLDELFNDSQAGGTSPLAGICQSEVLKPWNETIIRKFIDSRLKAPWLKSVTNPVSFTEEEIALLIAESGGHPQKLMQLCYQTYAGYLEEIQ